eukprot:m51a1_g12862 hypothetical protein (243) ;mRNA; f:109-3053
MAKETASSVAKLLGPLVTAITATSKRYSQRCGLHPLLLQYRQATMPAAHQDYDNTVVQAFIIAISTLTRNRVILTTKEAVQARTDCLEVLYFTTPFWDPTENTMQNATTSLTAVAAEMHRLSRLSARGRAMDGPKAMLNAVRSIKDKIKGAKQASKETSSASGDDAESSSSESIDELQGKKVVEHNVDDDQEEHKEKTTTHKRTREESNEEYVAPAVRQAMSNAVPQIPSFFIHTHLYAGGI